MRTARRWLGVAGAALLWGCSGVAQLDLTTLGRATWQRPDDVVRALAIEPGARVADLGSGEGYFVPYLAEAVGPAGRVYAVDVDAEITREIEERLGPSHPNLEIVLAELTDPLLPDGGVDLVLLVNTYHHIEDRTAYFDRLRTDLSEGGRVAIIEPDAELSGVLRLFLDAGHASRASDVADEMAAAGYRGSVSHDLLPVQIFEVFRPVARGAVQP